MRTVRFLTWLLVSISPIYAQSDIVKVLTIDEKHYKGMKALNSQHLVYSTAKIYDGMFSKVRSNQNTDLKENKTEEGVEAKD